MRLPLVAHGCVRVGDLLVPAAGGRTVKVSDVASVEFTPRKTEPPPAAPNPARAPAPVSLPMGTMLNVRLTQATRPKYRDDDGVSTGIHT